MVPASTMGTFARCAASIARCAPFSRAKRPNHRSEEHTSELQSQSNLVCRLLLEKKKTLEALTERGASIGILSDCMLILPFYPNNNRLTEMKCLNLTAFLHATVTRCA